MTVRVGDDRYIGLNQYIDKNWSQVSSSSSVHLATFIVPALLLSIILNIPKFLEAELVNTTTITIIITTITITIIAALQHVQLIWTAKLSKVVFDFLTATLYKIV